MIAIDFGRSKIDVVLPQVDKRFLQNSGGNIVRHILMGLLLCLSPLSRAESPARVPVIGIADFSPGRSWTWDYSQTDTGERTSSETYTVTQVAGSNVTIEMSTMFPGESEFHVHHRLIVPLDRCLSAYQNPGVVRSWSFRMFYRDENGNWSETVPPTTLAFEEKFNCDPWVSDTMSLLTVFRDGVNGREFMHKPSRRLEASWFSETGSDVAVLIEKPFTRRPGFPSYVSRRR